MRGFASYLLAGILAVLALDVMAPPVGLGLAVGAWPAVQHEKIIQIVDRTHKGDRLVTPTADGKRPVQIKPPGVMVGCEPAFSPLSASARANFSGRCVA